MDKQVVETSNATLSVFSDPEVKALAASKLDARMAGLRAQLDSLQAEYTSLVGDAPVATPAKKGRKASATATGGGSGGRKRGRPVGSTPAHGEAILAVLKGTKGLQASEIITRLTEANHPADPVNYAKTIRTYLSKMANASDGRLAVSGDKGSLVYRRAPKAATAPAVTAAASATVAPAAS